MSFTTVRLPSGLRTFSVETRLIDGAQLVIVERPASKDTAAMSLVAGGSSLQPMKRQLSSPSRQPKCSGRLRSCGSRETIRCESRPLRLTQECDLVCPQIRVVKFQVKIFANLAPPVVASDGRSKVRRAAQFPLSPALCARSGS